MNKQTVSSNKITLWTAQKNIVLDTINRDGLSYVKKEYIEKKYRSVSNIFLEPYNWFVKNAKQIVPKPEYAQYPVWLWVDKRFVEKHDDTVILKIEVDRDKAIIFDRAKWNKILNLSYIPKNKDDGKKYQKKLERYGVKDETDIYMSNFYPQLKREVIKSWDRLFDDKIKMTEVKRATLWELRKEWIVDVEK